MKRLAVIFGVLIIVLLGLPAAVQAKNYCIRSGDSYAMKDLSEGDPEIAYSVPIQNCDTPQPTPSYILAIPERPTIVKNTCKNKAYVVLPDIAGVDYTYVYSYLVEATPKFGYYFDPLSEDQTVFYKFTLKRAGEGLNCPSPS